MRKFFTLRLRQFPSPGHRVILNETRSSTENAVISAFKVRNFPTGLIVKYTSHSIIIIIALRQTSYFRLSPIKQSSSNPPPLKYTKEKKCRSGASPALFFVLIVSLLYSIYSYV